MTLLKSDKKPKSLLKNHKSLFCLLTHSKCSFFYYIVVVIVVSSYLSSLQDYVADFKNRKNVTLDPLLEISAVPCLLVFYLEI